MIDARTVRAIATARGLDPDTTGVVTFQIPPTHPLVANGQVAAMLGTFGVDGPARGFHADDRTVAYGESEEAAAKALFAVMLTDAQAAETKASADAAVATQARQAVEAAVAADETAAALAALEARRR